MAASPRVESASEPRTNSPSLLAAKPDDPAATSEPAETIASETTIATKPIAPDSFENYPRTDPLVHRPGGRPPHGPIAAGAPKPEHHSQLAVTPMSSLDRAFFRAYAKDQPPAAPLSEPVEESVSPYVHLESPQNPQLRYRIEPTHAAWGQATQAPHVERTIARRDG